MCPQQWFLLLCQFVGVVIGVYDYDYPRCSITNEYLFKGDSTLLVCDSGGGIPPPTLEWSKDGVVHEGQWLDSNTGLRRLGLQINLTSDVEGAVFVCKSDHPTYDNTRYCEIGPLVYEDLAAWSDWWFWLLLGLVVLAFIVILVLLIICCCCCRRRQNFAVACCGDCLNKLLAACPCCVNFGCFYIAQPAKEEVAVIERGVLISETGAGAPMGFIHANGQVNRQTQTPGYVSFHDVNYSIYNRENIKKNNTKYVDDPSNQFSLKMRPQRVDNLKNQHMKTTTNTYHTSVHSKGGKNATLDKEEELRHPADDNKKQDGRMEGQDNEHIYEEPVVTVKKDRESEVFGQVKSDEIDGNKGKHHSVHNSHHHRGNYFTTRDDTTNLLPETDSESISSDEEIRKLRMEDGTKEIVINGDYTMSGITRDELLKLAKFRDSLGEPNENQTSLTRSQSQKSSTSRNSAVHRRDQGKYTAFDSSSFTDGYTDGKHRSLGHTLSTNLKRRPYRITPDSVRWGKTQPEALARELGTDRYAYSDGEDYETLHTLRSHRSATDYSMFTASAWDDEEVKPTPRVTFENSLEEHVSEV